ncbi:2EXR domain-containing protein [Aspergillus homomorphus CBS 101889]|uniref:2EXR domain-containing protein n=1 Tax=Aspergillus homomorphus (strain CBS 101889) TaxID=1450537 RepID=A0A395I330_ASPHC|nr:hypothetical protein BO97DRAFT_422775 [Aspergillus homomorphus CBS 101889]RAL14357.1 hypothetical protein BO97DRAFT_422775 [Aspergillus homomorphus CBS 101889]
MKIINPARDAQRGPKPNTFPRFVEFPAELRYQIWEMSLPDIPCPREGDSTLFPAETRHWKRESSTDRPCPAKALLVEIPVALLLVNKEARKIALPWIRRQKHRWEFDSHVLASPLNSRDLYWAIWFDYARKIFTFSRKLEMIKGWQDAVYLSPDDYVLLRTQMRAGSLPRLDWNFCTVAVSLELLETHVDALAVLANGLERICSVLVVVSGLPRNTLQIRTTKDCCTVEFEPLDRSKWLECTWNSSVIKSSVIKPRRRFRRKRRSQLRQCCDWKGGQTMFAQEVYDLIQEAAQHLPARSYRYQTIGIIPVEVTNSGFG